MDAGDWLGWKAEAGDWLGWKAEAGDWLWRRKQIIGTQASKTDVEAAGLLLGRNNHRGQGHVKQTGVSSPTQATAKCRHFNGWIVALSKLLFNARRG